MDPIILFICVHRSAFMILGVYEFASGFKRRPSPWIRHQHNIVVEYYWLESKSCSFQMLWTFASNLTNLDYIYMILFGLWDMWVFCQFDSNSDQSLHGWRSSPLALAPRLKPTSRAGWRWLDRQGPNDFVMLAEMHCAKPNPDKIKISKKNLYRNNLIIQINKILEIGYLYYIFYFCVF